MSALDFDFESFTPLSLTTTEYTVTVWFPSRPCSYVLNSRNRTKQNLCHAYWCSGANIAWESSQKTEGKYCLVPPQNSTPTLETTPRGRLYTYHILDKLVIMAKR